MSARNDKLFDIILEEAFDKYAEDIANEEIPCNMTDEEAAAMEQQKQRVYNNVKKRIRAEKRPQRIKTVRRIFVIAAAVAALFAAAMSVSAFRTFVYKTYTDIKGTRLVVESGKITDEDYSTIIKFKNQDEIIVPGWLPADKEMKIEKIIDNEDSFSVEYYDKDGRYFVKLSAKALPLENSRDILPEANGNYGLSWDKDYKIMGMPGRLIYVLTNKGVENYTAFWNTNNVDYRLDTNCPFTIVDNILKEMRYLNGNNEETKIKSQRITDEQYNILTTFEPNNEIIVPGWLPPGMEIYQIYENETNVSIDYYDDKDNFFQIQAYRLPVERDGGIRTKNNTVKVEDCTVMGMPGKLIYTRSEIGNENYDVYWCSDNVEYMIDTNYSRIVLDTILQNLKYLNRNNEKAEKRQRIENEKYNIFNKFKNKDEIVVPGWLYGEMEIEKIEGDENSILIIYKDGDMFVRLQEHTLPYNFDGDLSIENHTWVKDYEIMGIPGKLAYIKYEDGHENYTAYWCTDNTAYKLDTNYQRSALDVILDDLKYFKK